MCDSQHTLLAFGGLACTKCHTPSIQRSVRVRSSSLRTRRRHEPRADDAIGYLEADRTGARAGMHGAMDRHVVPSLEAMTGSNGSVDVTGSTRQEDLYSTRLPNAVLALRPSRRAIFAAASTGTATRIELRGLRRHHPKCTALVRAAGLPSVVARPAGGHKPKRFQTAATLALWAAYS